MEIIVVELPCPRNEIIKVCPICGSEQLPVDHWPQMGTHAFSVPYKCGTSIDYPIGYGGGIMSVSCCEISCFGPDIKFTDEK